MKLKNLCDKIQISFLIREGIKERELWSNGKIRLVKD